MKKEHLPFSITQLGGCTQTAWDHSFYPSVVSLFLKHGPILMATSSSLRLQPIQPAKTTASAWCLTVQCSVQLSVQPAAFHNTDLEGHHTFIIPPESSVYSTLFSLSYKSLDRKSPRYQYSLITTWLGIVIWRLTILWRSSSVYLNLTQHLISSSMHSQTSTTWQHYINLYPSSLRDSVLYCYIFDGTTHHLLPLFRLQTCRDSLKQVF